jgi:hypothetical protein
MNGDFRVIYIDLNDFLNHINHSNHSKITVQTIDNKHVINS